MPSPPKMEVVDVFRRFQNISPMVGRAKIIMAPITMPIIPPAPSPFFLLVFTENKEQR